MSGLCCVRSGSSRPTAGSTTHVIHQTRIGKKKSSSSSVSPFSFSYRLVFLYIPPRTKKREEWMKKKKKKGADVSVCAHTTCVHTHRHALTAWASFSLVSPSEYNITTLPDIYRLSLGYTYRFSHMCMYTRSAWYACCGWGQQANPSWPKSAFLLGYDSKRKKGATKFHSSSGTLTRGCPVLYCVPRKTFWTL